MHENTKLQFASDNYAGICPQAWSALEQANSGFARPYGEDEWTARAADKLREIFESDCEVFFTATGTAANSLAVATVCRPYHSLICHRFAHLETDECGAPEFFANGTKILTVESPLGKVTTAAVEAIVDKRDDIHYPKPRAVSVTQSTELGTVYSVDELRELAALAHKRGLVLHMDGARFANAVAALGLSPGALTAKAGVDVLCLGGTKNGMPPTEAVIFFRKELAAEFDYRCKQAGQLISKMRYLAAPWVSMLEKGTWLEHAAHANRAAARLRKGLEQIPGLDFPLPTEANAVFVAFPPRVKQCLLERGWHFYSFIGTGQARLMCSWNTKDEDVDQLVAEIGKCMS